MLLAHEAWWHGITGIYFGIPIGCFILFIAWTGLKRERK